MPALQIIMRIPGLLIGISVHEYAHARIAYNLGDDTAAREGRLTLEPWAHLDLIGSIMLLLFGFGWARPVSVNPYMLRDPRKDMAKVAVAGPVANLITAAVLQIITVLFYTRVRFAGTAWAYLPMVIQDAAWINASLAFFNMVPIPPLDGSKILQVFLPARAYGVWDFIERYGPLLLIIFVSLRLVSVFVMPFVSGYMTVIQNVAFRISMLIFK